MNNKTKMKKCEMCGREFLPLAGNQRFCSLVCSKAAQKIRRGQWEAQNRDYYKQYRARSGSEQN